MEKTPLQNPKFLIQDKDIRELYLTKFIVYRDPHEKKNLQGPTDDSRKIGQDHAAKKI